MTTRERTSAVRFLTGLTLARVLAVPVIMALLLARPEDPAAATIAAVLFASAALTDFFDGLLARRWDATTTLGAFLDTTADKLLVVGVLITLVELGRVWAWAAVLIIAREIIVTAMRSVGAAAGGGMTIPVSRWGKLKAAVQFLAIIAAMLRPDVILGPLWLDQWLMLVAVAVTIQSAVGYLVQFRSTMANEGI